MSELGIKVEGFDKHFDSFLEGAQAIINRHYAELDPEGKYGTHPTLVYEIGPKYIRVIKETRGSRSVYCFVDRTTGNILKGNWKSPVKNGVRGSIMSENYGLDRVNWHGCIYLR